MKKLILIAALAVISFASFSKTNNPTKKEKSTKENIPRKKISKTKQLDCFPIEANLSCVTILGTMCVDATMTPLERQAAFEELVAIQEDFFCNSQP